jgi:hypothetical protein
VLLRMLNDPCQSETGRQMARANPQYRCEYALSQVRGAALARAVKFLDCLGRDNTLRQLRDKGQYREHQIVSLGKSFPWANRPLGPDEPGPSALPYSAAPLID